MHKARAVRCLATFGAALFVLAYCGFVLAGLNGGAASLSDLWKTLAFAHADVLVAWGLFAASGLAAFIFRDKLRHRLIVVGFLLVCLPACWALGVFLFYNSRLDGSWPGFENELWRWLINHVYAEFSVGLVIGHLGAVGVTLAGKQASDAT